MFTFDEVGVDHVVMHHLEIGMADPLLDAVLSAGEEVVQSDHLVAFHHESIDEVRSDEAGATSHQDSLAGRVW